MLTSHSIEDVEQAIAEISKEQKQAEKEVKRRVSAAQKAQTVDSTNDEQAMSEEDEPPVPRVKRKSKGKERIVEPTSPSSSKGNAAKAQAPRPPSPRVIIYNGPQQLQRSQTFGAPSQTPRPNLAKRKPISDEAFNAQFDVSFSADEQEQRQSSSALDVEPATLPTRTYGGANALPPTSENHPRARSEGTSSSAGAKRARTSEGQAAANNTPTGRRRKRSIPETEPAGKPQKAHLVSARVIGSWSAGASNLFIEHNAAA